MLKNAADSDDRPNILAAMAESSASEKNLTVPPPLSLTTCWDKGKWHFEAASFPRNLKTTCGYTHILSPCFAFLMDAGNSQHRVEKN